jgi:hypothetical protein
MNNRFMQPTTAIITATATIVAAFIAGSIAIYLKRLDRWHASELKHSERREQAYESFIASCDRAWHLRSKKAFDEYKGQEPISSDEFKRIRKLVEQQTMGALEDLQRYSGDYKRASPILLRLYDAAFEGKRARPAAFEAARVAAQDLQRQELGLRKKLGLTRKASYLEEYKIRKEIRDSLKNVESMRVIVNDGTDDSEVMIYQGDGEGIWRLLEENMKEWEELEASIKRQELRSERWRKVNLWPE